MRDQLSPGIPSFSLSEWACNNLIRKKAESFLGALPDHRFLEFWYEDISTWLHLREIPIWDDVWRLEYDRRFLLRPAEYVPGNNDLLVRAL